MINPSQIECDDIIEWLDDYRRHKLEPHLRVIVSEHLANCDNCAEELRLREALVTHLTDAIADEPAAPAELSPQVQRAIAAMNPDANARKSPQLLPWMLTGAAVILLSVAVLQTQLFDTAAPSTELASAPEAALFSRQMPAQDAALADSPASMAPPAAAPAAAEAKEAAPAVARRMSFAEPAQSLTTAPMAKTTTATAELTTAPAEQMTTATVTNTTAPANTPPPQPE